MTRRHDPALLRTAGAVVLQGGHFGSGTVGWGSWTARQVFVIKRAEPGGSKLTQNCDTGGWWHRAYPACSTTEVAAALQFVDPTPGVSRQLGSAMPTLPAHQAQVGHLASDLVVFHALDSCEVGQGGLHDMVAAGAGRGKRTGLRQAGVCCEDSAAKQRKAVNRRKLAVIGKAWFEGRAATREGDNSSR